MEIKQEKMKEIKPINVKGTKDFNPLDMHKRNILFDIFRGCFKTFSFNEISTPCLENYDTLNGKYGEEGGKLIFNILNNGDFLSNIENEELKQTIGTPNASKMMLPQISKIGLRYDLTVPCARYVASHINEIVFPFRRYQIQPVFRADRPQTGRWREFYQCDADIIGSNDLMSEVELIDLMKYVFKSINFDDKIVIRVNNRKILNGIADVVGITDRFSEFLSILDKMDKIGIKGVDEMLNERGFEHDKIQKIMDIIVNFQTLDSLETILSNSEIGKEGINEIKYINAKTPITFDITLARGLDYYTGTIFEVTYDDKKFKLPMSIAGGGRYDNLTAMFGLDNVSGVGISFGFERIYAIWQLLPCSSIPMKNYLFITLEEKANDVAYSIIQKIRNNHFKKYRRTPIFQIYKCSYKKIREAFRYANANNFENIVIIGEDEIKTATIKIKNQANLSERKILINDFIKNFE